MDDRIPDQSDQTRVDGGDTHQTAKSDNATAKWLRDNAIAISAYNDELEERGPAIAALWAAT